METVNVFTSNFTRDDFYILTLRHAADSGWQSNRTHHYKTLSDLVFSYCQSAPVDQPDARLVINKTSAAKAMGITKQTYGRTWAPRFETLVKIYEAYSQE